MDTRAGAVKHDERLFARCRPRRSSTCLRRGEVSPREVLDATRGADRRRRSHGQCAADALLRAGADACARRLREATGASAASLAGCRSRSRTPTRSRASARPGARSSIADHVSTRSDYLVEAIEAAGGIVYAKSNTPEFQAGANTFNEVFGRTLNPWDTSRSAAGSSGGAAVAVATGMAYIAQGSDNACSLRYPAAFCGVVGLRPSPGLVPQGPSALPYQVLSVIGPIARTRRRYRPRRSTGCAASIRATR